MQDHRPQSTALVPPLEEPLRVLFVSEFLPWPLNSGGRIRSYHLLRQVAQRHKVVLLAADFDGVANHFETLVEAVHCPVTVPRSRCGKLWGAAASLASRKPYLAAYAHYRQEMARQLRAVLADRPFDLIHLDHLDMAIYLRDCRPTAIYLDQHNFETRLFRSVLENTSNLLVGAYLRLQHRRLAAFETAVLGSVDAVGAVSPQDAAAMREVAAGADVTVVPNGVDLEYFDIPRQPLPQRVVSVGSLDWPPNVEGLLWFLDQVWPRVKQALPAAVFQIVGRRPPRELLQRQSADVRIDGSVPDVRPYMSEASAFVIPLFAGGGTRLKALEAMAMRTPIVSTTVGIDGIPCVNGRHLLLADDADSFARQLLVLLADDGPAEQLAGEARRLVESEFSWRAIGDTLNQVYLRTARRQTTGVAAVS